LDGVLRDAFRADIFIWTRGAGAGCAESKLAVVFVIIAFAAIHAAVFSIFGPGHTVAFDILPVRFFGGAYC